MHEWLYGEEGYYSHKRTIGKEGDFYTAVSTSMFFGGSIAKKLINTIESGFLSPSCHVVEIGAHKGYLLADMIQFLFSLKPSLLESLTFVIVEPFLENQAMQKEYFQEAFGDAISFLHVKSVEELKSTEAFIVANEIFDAFCCEIIKDEQILHVENHQPVFKQLPAAMRDQVQKMGISKGEVCFEYAPFAKALSRSFDRYEFVTFDYGDKDAREDFSLRVYSHHQTYPFFTLTDLVEESLQAPKTLKELFGKSDITYDVNFTHLIDAFVQSGARVEGYATQMRALVEFGLIELLEMLQKNVSYEAYLREMNKVKILLDPSFMGERFKVLCLRFG